MTAADFKINTGNGRAFPVFAHELAPAALDKAAGADKARKAREAANEAGAAASRAHSAALAAWDAEHKAHDYAMRAEYLHARDFATREEAAELKRKEREAGAALRAYYAAQQAGRAAAASAASATVDELDGKLEGLLAELRETFEQRAALARTAGRMSNAPAHEPRLMGTGAQHGNAAPLLELLELLRQKGITR